jgi:leucyl aminopeptidase
MKINIRVASPLEVSSDLLAIPIFSPGSGKKQKSGKRKPRLTGAAATLDRALGGIIKRALDSGDLRGQSSERVLLYPDSPKRGARPPRILLLGVGAREDLDLEGIRRYAGAAASESRARKLLRVGLLAPRGRRILETDCAAALSEGALLGAYRFERFKSSGHTGRGKASVSTPRTCTLFFDPQESVERVLVTDLRSRSRAASLAADCQNLARDLSNTPGNALPPAGLSREARKIARETGMTCHVIRGAELERGGFSALLAVGGGSVNAPQLIVLEHRGARAKASKAAPLCLVGKGITFDSGGISIKPSANMADMKHDMSGAATVLGTMRAAALLKLPLHVVGVIAAAENLPSATAYRPGDVVKSRAGKTIEIGNTDAEGRVVLADAIDYAVKRFAPAAMVDLATLTGAAMMAFGPWATAALGNDDDLLRALRDAGDEAGERIWPMPLLREHSEAIKSSVADIRNIGGPQAGVSTAGAFLKEFVGETPWVHLDIAGTAWTAQRSAYHRQGATGVGVRTLLAWMASRVQQKR